MPYLQPKSRSGMSWLSSQVFYGIDCSDPDPANWFEFGELVQQQAEKASQDATTASATSSAARQSTPKAP